MDRDLGRAAGVRPAKDPDPKLRNDAEIAASVAGTLGVPHVVLSEPRPTVAGERRKNQLTNFGAMEHAWALPIVDYLAGRVEAVFDGLAGDVLSASLFMNRDLLALLRSGDVQGAARHILGKSDAAISALIAGGRCSGEEAMARAGKELRRHIDAPDPIASFFFWNRTRRTVSLVPFGILLGFDAHAPYLDHAVFDFLVSLPLDMTWDQKFHTDAIQRAFPDLRVPYASRHPHHSYRWEAGLALDLLLRAPGSDWSMVRQRYVLPRLARCLADQRYSGAAKWLVRTVAYLQQLGPSG